VSIIFVYRKKTVKLLRYWYVNAGYFPYSMRFPVWQSSYLWATLISPQIITVFYGYFFCKSKTYSLKAGSYSSTLYFNLSSSLPHVGMYTLISKNLSNYNVITLPYFECSATWISYHIFIAGYFENTATPEYPSEYLGKFQYEKYPQNL